MRDMALYASIRGVLEKRWFMAELGFSLTTLLEAFIKTLDKPSTLRVVLCPMFVSGLLQELPMSHKTASRFHAT